MVAQPKAKSLKQYASQRVYSGVRTVERAAAEGKSRRLEKLLRRMVRQQEKSG